MHMHSAAVYPDERLESDRNHVTMSVCLKFKGAMAKDRPVCLAAHMSRSQKHTHMPTHGTLYTTRAQSLGGSLIRRFMANFSFSR